MRFKYLFFGFGFGLAFVLVSLLCFHFDFLPYFSVDGWAGVCGGGEFS